MSTAAKDKLKMLMESDNPSSDSNKSGFKNYANMCIKTPLLYIAITPFILLVLLYLVKPSFIFEKKQNKKVLSWAKLLSATFLGTIIINVGLFVWLKQGCF